MTVASRFKNASLSGLLIEFISVIFAVFVALAANQWKENLANRRLAESALANIYKEIEMNKTEIAKAIAEHEATVAELKTRLEHVQARGDKQTTEQSGHTRFHYEHSLLTQTSWKSAILTQAVKFIDYDYIESFSNIYELQSFYDNHGRELFSKMGSIEYQEASEISWLKASLINVSLSLNIERKLLEEYDRALENKK